MQKFIEGDVCKSGRTEYVVWHQRGEKVWVASGITIDAGDLTLYSRRGFRVGMAVVVDGNQNNPRTIVSLNETGALFAADSMAAYDRLKPFVAPEPPKWEAFASHCGSGITDGDIVLTYTVGKRNSVEVVKIMDCIVNFLNSRDEKGVHDGQ